MERTALKGMETFWGAEFLVKGKNEHMFTRRQADNHTTSLSTFQAEV